MDSGVLVQTIEPNSPAQKAGLREGDVIVALDSKPVGSVDDLLRHLAEERIGVTTPLAILRRDGRAVERLVLEIAPAESYMRKGSRASGKVTGRVRPLQAGPV